MMFSLLSAVRISRSLVLATTTLALTSLAAHAGTINIVNGDFNTSSASTEFGSRYGGQVLNGWTTGGYNFVFQAGTADTTGAASEYGTIKLWGPNDGSSNGLTASSPAGGSFVAMDGGYAQGTISQTISGFSAGDIVSVTFDYAYSQQSGNTGMNTEDLLVSLGNQSIATTSGTIASKGFSGWQSTTLNFTATSSSEVLSFLAQSGPNGAPPFVLLDGVTASSHTPVPEPSSLALLGTGLASAAGLLRKKLKK